MFLKQTKKTSENFKKALALAEQKKEKALFVFDMDSTLFCMKYRTQAILENIAREEETAKKFPNQLPVLKSAKVTERDWSVRDILSRHGLSPEDPLLSWVEKKWRKGFFSNDYLHLDRPYEGSVDFLQKIAGQRVQIYYLTARKQEKMYEGTVQSIKQWDFPFKSDEHLIMRASEEAHLSDAQYKVKHLKKLIQISKPLVFFENEPVILNAAAKALPQIQLFWMNSTHCGEEEPPESALPLNMNYSF